MPEQTIIDTGKDTNNTTVDVNRRKRVNRIKTTIIIFIIILFLVPTLLSIILGIRLNRLQRQVDKLFSTYSDGTELVDKNKKSGQYAYASTDDQPRLYEDEEVVDEYIRSNDIEDSYMNSLNDISDNNNIINIGDNKINETDIENIDTSDRIDSNNKIDNSNNIDNSKNIDSNNENDTGISMDIDNNNNNVNEAGNIRLPGKNKSDSTYNTENSVTDNWTSDKDKSTNDEKPIYEGKKVYLSFDDGPTKNTDTILDILAEYNVKATFFVIGHEDEESKERYKRIVNEGHILAIHSYSHNYKEIYKSIEDFDKDFTKLWKLLYDTTGYSPTLYRFPGGSLSFENKSEIKDYVSYLNEKGMTYYDWNVVNGDAEGKEYTEEQMIENVLYGVERKKTSIVLMHDGMGKDKTVSTLPIILETLITGGAELLPMDKTVPLIQQIKATNVK